MALGSVHGRMLATSCTAKLVRLSLTMFGQIFGWL